MEFSLMKNEKNQQTTCKNDITTQETEKKEMNK
jgi:hypothetical protein